MRYSIMLQLVTLMTLILVGAAALFGWLQRRPGAKPQDSLPPTLGSSLDARKPGEKSQLNP